MGFMKRLLLIGLIGCCVSAETVMAVPNGKVVGAVAGTAAGLIIANNVHGVNPWVAAPVGALLGGYLGSRYEQYRYEDASRDWRYDRYNGYPDRYPYRSGYRHNRRYYPHPEPRTTVIYVEKPGRKEPVITPPSGDPQPGIDLIKVSILNSNGIRTDIPLLRIKGKFVGPQGESYDVLPTTEQLTKLYGM